jgi:hypothetical protein
VTARHDDSDGIAAAVRECEATCRTSGDFAIEFASDEPDRH